MRLLAAWINNQVAQLLSKIDARSSLFDTLPQHEVEYQPREISCRPGLYEPEQIGRITKCNRNHSVDYMMRIWTETTWTEAPLSIYRLGPAVVLGGTVITRHARHWICGNKASLFDVLHGVEHKPEIVLANSTQGLGFFGHWLGDDCASFQAFQDHPELRSMCRPAWPDMAFYERAFQQNWTEHEIMHTDNLILLRGLGFGNRKTERYRTLRSRLRKKVADRPASGRIVFIQRGASAKKRDITNWNELSRRLEDRGIDILTPEGDTEAFVRSILDASLIITVEGSQACHAIYALRDGGALLVLQPPFQFYTAAQEWMRSLDMHCGMVIGHLDNDGFRVDPDEVLRMADRLLALSQNREAV